MAQQVYSFRAESGFVPEGMTTGKYIKNLSSGGMTVKNTSKLSTVVMTLLFTAIPLLLLLGNQYKQNKELQKKIKAMVNDINGIKEEL